MLGLIFGIIISLSGALIGYFYAPSPDQRIVYAGITFIISIILLLLIKRIEKAEFQHFWGGLFGFLLSVFIAFLLIKISPVDKPWLKNFIAIVLPLAGLYFGIDKSEWFRPSTIKSIFKEKKETIAVKILDTSAVIDGRIADLCETGFLEGKVFLPSFIMNELQQVADSSDSLKRQRGRRGFDFLEQLKKCPNIDFKIIEKDYPDIKEVDHKLLQLAKDLRAKVITTDFNLNKLAKIQGIKILNINELANALKPIVLPGEKIKAYILKEGKEKDQGVAYLEDGTMVVVDNARKMIGQTIDITVTSVLQTVAGKMIFGRYEP